METRKRGSNHMPRRLQTKVEIPSRTADVPATTKASPKVTLGSVTKRETKDHRKKVLRNKVQKAKK